MSDVKKLSRMIHGFEITFDVDGEDDRLPVLASIGDMPLLRGQTVVDAIARAERLLED